MASLTGMPTAPQAARPVRQPYPPADPILGNNRHAGESGAERRAPHRAAAAAFSAAEPSRVGPSAVDRAIAADADASDAAASRLRMHGSDAAGAAAEASSDPTSAHSAALPPGWRKVASNSAPGAFYFVDPRGQATWTSPLAVSSGARAANARKLATIYTQDYRRWTELAGRFNPSAVDASVKPSASYGAHPKAAKGASLFASDYGTNYVDHAASLQPPQPAAWPPFLKTAFTHKSTYGEDFAPHAGTARRVRRVRTPPRVAPFGHTSLSRQDFIDFHPKRPVMHKPKPQLHFRHGGPSTSTYRREFAPVQPELLLACRRPRFWRDPAWLRAVPADDGGFDADAAAATAAVVGGAAASGGSAKAPRRPQTAPQRFVSVLREAPGDFHTIYETDFVDALRPGGLMPPGARRDSLTVDASVVGRNKSHGGALCEAD